MSKAPISRAAAINAKCRDCIYDPMAAGTWREQVAACPGAHCPLHPIRPVPRACKPSGFMDPQAIAAVRQKLELRDRRASTASSSTLAV